MQAQIFVNQFIIGICPVTLLVGELTLVAFGFAAFYNIVLTVFLRAPVKMGGYGITSPRNADFIFSLWFGILVAHTYGHLVNGRIPLWVYRLHALWLPGLVTLPISLGLFGASLQYYLHYMVLALACFLGGYATNSLMSFEVNYVIERFKGHAAESAAIMGLYRLASSLSLPFFVPAWIAKVGSGWCLGMAAFFSVFAFRGIVLLLWKGEAICQLSLKNISSNEGGMRIMEKDDDSAEA